jgi:hypothetical protein
MPKRRKNPLELMIVNPGKVKEKNKWPKKLVGMGTCPELEIVPNKKKRKKTITFSRRSEPVVATDISGKSIFVILECDDKGNASQSALGDGAMRKFKEFHFNALPDSISRIDIDWPSSLKKIGKCKSVSYRAYDHTKKRGTPYRHEFKVMPEAYIDPDEKVIYITGNSIAITDWIRG